MTSIKEFRYKGLYAVQSRRQYVESEIKGSYYSANNTLSSDTINEILFKNPYWKGNHKVTLKAAKISYREGLFLKASDILIKKQFFIPAKDCEPMDYDLIDVKKSSQLWKSRINYIEQLLGKDFKKIVALIGVLDQAIINEYFCHEAGHMLGYDVIQKYNDKYFRIEHKSIWPLIFIEEFRADLHSFELAADNLHPEQAIGIFLYNILLRLGVEAQSRATNSDGYGALGFLLFSYLLNNEIIQISNNKIISFNCLETEYLLSKMREAGKYAYNNFTYKEIEFHSVDARINSVKLYNSFITNQEVINIFNSVFSKYDFKEDI